MTVPCRPGRPRGTGARRGAAALAALTATAVLTPAARAHSPIFFTPRNASPAAPLLVKDGTVSIAAYGRLDGGTRAFHLAVKLPAGTREPLEVLVPAGTPARPAARVAVRPPGGTWQPVRALATPETFHEPYGGQDYLRTHRGRLGSAAGGTFLVRIILPAGVASRPVCVATGSREVFLPVTDLGEALARIRAWARG